METDKRAIRELIVADARAEMESLSDGAVSTRKGYADAIEGFLQNGLAGLEDAHYFAEDFFGVATVDSTNGRREHDGFVEAATLIRYAI